MFRTWLETTWDDLFWGTVAAFPHTKKRQHATDPIEIDNIRMVPFIGMKTLLLRSEAYNPETEKQYHPIILFKAVQYLAIVEAVPNTVTFVASDDGNEYRMERPSLADHNVLLRCECGDFFWRFHHYNKLDRSLWGHNRKPYESKGVGPPANPNEAPGMCKHLMKMTYDLRASGLLVG